MSVNGFLHPTPPFDFSKSLHILQTLPALQKEQLVWQNGLMKASAINRQPFLFFLKSVGTVEHPRLEYRLLSKQIINENDRFTLLNRISDLLSLYDNLDEFYQCGAEDPGFNHLIRRLYGYHQVRFLTPFENVCWSILSHNQEAGVARTAKQRLMTHLGQSMRFQQHQLFAFPEPIELVNSDPGELGKLIGSTQKAADLYNAAQAFLTLAEDFFRESPRREVFQWLSNLDGLGADAANSILSGGLGMPEQVFIADRNLIEMAARFYGAGIYEDISYVISRYGQWQEYWAHYLRVAA